MDTVVEVTAPATALLTALLETVSDDLDELGDRTCATALVAGVVRAGTGAAQQHRARLARTLQRWRVED